MGFAVAPCALVAEAIGREIDSLTVEVPVDELAFLTIAVAIRKDTPSGHPAIANVSLKDRFTLATREVHFQFPPPRDDSADAVAVPGQAPDLIEFRMP